MLNQGLQAVSFGQVRGVRLNVNIREPAIKTYWMYYRKKKIANISDLFKTKT